MSYDIRFGVKVAGTENVFAVIGEPQYSSPTYNLGKMFRKCMDWDYEQGQWYKMTDVLPKIERGIHELKFNEKTYLQYNPENGWGDTRSALNALQSILNWFDPNGYEMGWNEDIPIDCIYMRW